MLLILSNKLDTTTDIVIDNLNKRKIPFVRWNTEDMLYSQNLSLEIVAGNLQRAVLSTEGRKIDLVRDVSVVWNRRPDKVRPHRAIKKSAYKEFVVREGSMVLSNLWAMLRDKVWVNHPVDNYALNNKLYQLRLAEQLGMETPPTLITNSPAEVRDFRKRNGDIAAKSLSAGVLRGTNGEQLIYTRKIRDSDMKNLGGIRLCPTLFQAYIPKKIELRVTVVGTSVFACAIESQLSTKTMEDWRRYDFSHVPHRPFELPHWLHKKVVAFLRKTNLNFGAFDFILTPDDRFVFLEINPNGQWYWIEHLTKLPITNTLVSFFEQSMKRNKHG